MSSVWSSLKQVRAVLVHGADVGAGYVLTTRSMGMPAEAPALAWIISADGPATSTRARCRRAQRLTHGATPFVAYDRGAKSLCTLTPVIQPTI